MRLLNKLQGTLLNYESGLRLPMEDIIDFYDADYNTISHASTEEIKGLAKADAEGWISVIKDETDVFLDDYAAQIKGHYTASSTLWKDAKESSDRLYERIALCYFYCAVLHATALFHEGFRRGVCIDVFYMGNDNIREVSEWLEKYNYDTCRKFLCLSCAKMGCAMRVASRQVKSITEDKDWEKVKPLLDIAVEKGVLNKEYQLNEEGGYTWYQAAMLAHCISQIVFGGKNTNWSIFKNLWAVKLCGKDKSYLSKALHDGLSGAANADSLDMIEDLFPDYQRLTE